MEIYVMLCLAENELLCKMPIYRYIGKETDANYFLFFPYTNARLKVLICNTLSCIFRVYISKCLQAKHSKGVVSIKTNKLVPEKTG